jgi:hypothetical protein
VKNQKKFPIQKNQILKMNQKLLRKLGKMNQTAKRRRRRNINIIVNIKNIPLTGSSFFIIIYLGLFINLRRRRNINIIVNIKNIPLTGSSFFIIIYLGLFINLSFHKFCNVEKQMRIIVVVSCLELLKLTSG